MLSLVPQRLSQRARILVCFLGQVLFSLDLGLCHIVLPLPRPGRYWLAIGRSIGLMSVQVKWLIWLLDQVCQVPNLKVPRCAKPYLLGRMVRSL